MKNIKIIYNKLIPFRGFTCINIFGVLFVREEYGKLSRVEINHESIHTAQMKELGYVLFYVIYVVEWIIHLCKVKNSKRAYYRISSEKEAYRHQENLTYLKTRKPYSQFRAD